MTDMVWFLTIVHIVVVVAMVLGTVTEVYSKSLLHNQNKTIKHENIFISLLRLYSLGPELSADYLLFSIRATWWAKTQRVTVSPLDCSADQPRLI